MEGKEQQDKQVVMSKPSKITTIKLSEETKARVDHLKRYPRETYEEILVRMLELLNLTRQSPERARISLIKLDKERRKNLQEK
jgi:predicted transcriptional regulator